MFDKPRNFVEASFGYTDEFGNETHTSNKVGSDYCDETPLGVLLCLFEGFLKNAGFVIDGKHLGLIDGEREL